MVLTRSGHTGELEGMAFNDGCCVRAFGLQIKKLRNQHTCHVFPIGTAYKWVSDMPIEIVVAPAPPEADAEEAGAEPEYPEPEPQPPPKAKPKKGKAKK